MLAGKVPGGPDRKRVLFGQAFHIRRFLPKVQPQEMAAGLESDGEINLMDMLLFFLLKFNLPCYVRAEIEKYEPCPYFMGDHLPAFCMKIYGSYCVL